MQILKIDADSRIRFAEKIPETGMGYHFVHASYRGESSDFLVLGSTYAVPLRSIAGLTDVTELTTAGSIDDYPSDAFVEGRVSVTEDFSGRPILARAALIQSLAAVLGSGASASALPPPGATLTVKTGTTGSDAYLRFSYTRHDPRIGANGAIAGKTYATTLRDGVIITSGLSAVGRYALPVPLPAEFVFVLLPPAATNVHLGAAVPFFGQAGGGVEAYFPDPFTNQTRCFTIPSY
jgi:hypothetical protein